ncbi:MAG: hypothetical protein WCJ37_03670 [Syntrophus sp. (in: bacteria)]
MSRKKINLYLNYREILIRIGDVKDGIYKEKKTRNKKWAELIGVSESLVSQLHPQKPRVEIKEPSLEYIIAVANKTGKPPEWYLYGDMPTTDKENNLISEPHSAFDANRKPHFCGPDWTDDDIRYCKQLKKILDSKNEVIVPAIISNLAAFEHSVTEEKRKSKEIDDLKSGMKKKSSEMKDLKKRLMHLEELTDPAGPNTGTDEVE